MTTMTMTSKFNGSCKACGGYIKAGEVITWTREAGAKHISLDACAKATASKVAAVAAAPVVESTGIAAFLMAARERGLKFPKARFLAPKGGELVLSIAGSGSKFPGSVQVKIDGFWVGRIGVDGKTAGPMTYSDGSVIATLTAIAADPVAAAKAYGALTCSCSFCGLKLTDEGSIEVGYGPICAKHWGLPHHPKGTKALTAVPVEGRIAEEDAVEQAILDAEIEAEFQDEMNARAEEALTDGERAWSLTSRSLLFGA
jgi:hypothetical protein